MKLLRKLGNIGFIVFLSILGLYIFFVNTIPEQVDAFLGYRFCHILTGSMEPMLPTDALVLVKNLQPEEEIQPGTIITFRANRFQDDVVITHYFDHIETRADGTTIYRTHANGVNTLDDYETTRADILGTYVYHVPYIGKIISFLKSPNAFVMMGILIIIYMLYKFSLCKVEEGEEMHTGKLDEAFSRLTKVKVYDQYITLYGTCDKNLKIEKGTKIDVVLYGRNRKIQERRKLQLVVITKDNKKILSWRCTIKKESMISGYAYWFSDKESNKTIHPLP